MKKIIVSIALVVLTGIAFTAPARAHAIVIRTEPADGATLDAAPAQVRVWFSEPVLFNLTTFELVDSDGKRVPVLPTRATDESLFGVALHLPALTPNAYRLSWKTVSSNDLHASSGSMVFGVQSAANISSDAASAPAPQLVEVWLRWLNIGALAGMIGALAILFLILPAIHQTETNAAILAVMRQRVLTLALAADALAFVAGTGLMLAQATNVGGAWWQIITQTSYGARSILGQGLLALLGALIFVDGIARANAFSAAANERVATRADHNGVFIRVLGRARASHSSARSVATRLAIFFLLSALVTLEVMNSHAASGVSPAALIAGVIHLFAAGVWAGGLIALTITVVPFLRHGILEMASARSVLRGFGALAASALGALVATGLYNAGVLVASLDALIVTLYGQTLLVKTGLGLCIALIGLINAALLHPRVLDMLRATLRRPAGWTPLDSRNLWRTVSFETIGALGILLFAATLSATPPARGLAFDPPSEQATALPNALANASDLFVAFSIKPNRPGQNFIELGVFDTRRPAPAPIERVTVQVRAPGETRNITLTAEPRGAGRYEISGGALNAPGAWNVTITIRRPGLPDATMTIPWTVFDATAVKPRPVLVSNRPLAPALTVAAGIVAFGLIALLVAFQIRRRVVLRAALPRANLNLGALRKE